MRIIIAIHLRLGYNQIEMCMREINDGKHCCSIRAIYEGSLKMLLGVFCLHNSDFK